MLCLDCNYPLRDLPAPRCPECGRAFAPSNPRTMNVGRPYGAVGAFFLSPVGRPTHLAATMATLAVFWWTAGLPHPLVAMVMGVCAWAAVYLYRIARAVGRRVARRIYCQPKRRPARSFVLLALIMLTGLTIWTRFPVRIVFAFHRPALERVARHHYEQVPMLAPEPPVRTWVGIYRLDILRVDVHGVAIQTGGDVTFRYEADDELADYYRGERHLHLGRGWYYNTSSEGRVLGRPVGLVLYKLFG